MSNERLRDALHAKGMTPVQLAESIKVDPKTVERWITSGRSPYARHRYAVATVLKEPETYLWPSAISETRKTLSSESEIVHHYPRRNVVPSELWRRLFDQATEQIEVLAFGGVFPFDNDPSLVANLEVKATSGARIRLLVGDPESPTLALRGAEEGTGAAMPARAQSVLSYFASLKDSPNVGVRKHGTTLYASIYRFDDQMLVNTHVYGSPASLNPVIHLRSLSGGTTFDLYTQSFERVWASALPAW